MSHRGRVTLSLAASDARAIAIAAQGLAVARRATNDQRALATLIDRLGAIQIDSVNVVARSHYLPAWSRLGHYQPADLDALSHEAPRAVFEYWGHEASLLPVALQPLLRWRMAAAADQAWRRVREIRRRRALVARVLEAVRERGPLRVSELPAEKSPHKRRAGWWEWNDLKVAMEWLFWSGQVTAARRHRFERLYDLPERVLPPAIAGAPTPTRSEAITALLARAARALGVATAHDLRDYYRIRPGDASGPLAHLLEQGTVVAARVAGWTKPAFVHRDFAGGVAPPSVDHATLLSPFDSLIWFRDRVERLFGMRYRIEIYTPAPQRVYGYYVMPLLLGDRLVARVDLKADRAAGVLRVRGAHGEPKLPRATAPALANELARLAAWLGLSGVTCDQVGDLSRPLSRALAR